MSSIVEAMNGDPENATVQMVACRWLGGCINTGSKESQDAAAAAGSLEASVGAMRRFPEDKELQKACIGASARPVLFNRGNCLRGGRLGGLNLTLLAYRRWMDDPAVTSQGGDIGCYLDYCNENRDILRELGGVHLLIQNIKNNFHGRYSDWGYEPVKHSLFGLSSGCWKNQDLCHAEGFVPLSLQLMSERTSWPKIAEEALQVVKALIAYSDEYRQEYAEQGLAAALAKVLKENPDDRGAISLACEAVRYLVGPAAEGGPTGERFQKSFSEENQARATREGLLEQLLATTGSRAALRHKDHGGFNFDVDAAFNAEADCLAALYSMGYQNKANTAEMFKAGVGDLLLAKIKSRRSDERSKKTATQLLESLDKDFDNATVAEQQAFLALLRQEM